MACRAVSSVEPSAPSRSHRDEAIDGPGSSARRRCGPPRRVASLGLRSQHWRHFGSPGPTLGPTPHSGVDFRDDESLPSNVGAAQASRWGTNASTFTGTADLSVAVILSSGAL